MTGPAYRGAMPPGPTSDHEHRGDDLAQRRRTVVVAGHRGDAATARRELTATDPSLRIAALGALERCDALAATELRTALRDPDTSVRRRAVEVVGDRRATCARNGSFDEVLVDLLAGPDAVVAEVSAWALGEVHEGAEDDTPASVLDALTHATSAHDEPLVREAAVAALGSIGAPSTLAAVLHATEDKATVRRRAVLALAAFEGPDVDAALARARSDRDWQVRQAAEDLS